MGFEALGKKLAQLGADTKTSVKKMSENYQMGSKIADEKKNLEKLFAQIGEAAYEKFAENPPEGLVEIFESVKSVKQTIAQLEEEKQKLGGIIVCQECGKEASKGEKFCSACGAKLPEEPVDEVKEKMKQDMKDAANEAGEIMNEAADKAKVLFSNFAEKADAFVKGVSSKLNENAENAEEVTEECCCEGAEEAKEECCCEGAEEAKEECCCEGAEEAKEECCCEGAEEAKEECCCEEAEEAKEECCCEGAEETETKTAELDEAIKQVQEAAGEDVQ